jgi:hypothetical protein
VKPCRKCGSTRRGKPQAKNPLGQCKDCQAAQRAAYHLVHRAEHRARKSAWSASHRAEERAYSAAYTLSHRAEIAARGAAYRASHRIELRAKCAAYRASHRADIAAYKHEHRDHNILAYIRQHTNNPDMRCNT